MDRLSVAVEAPKAAEEEESAEASARFSKRCTSAPSSWASSSAISVPDRPAPTTQTRREEADIAPSKGLSIPGVSNAKQRWRRSLCMRSENKIATDHRDEAATQESC